MTGRIAYFNGRFVPEAEVRVPIYDSALQIGDMAFEVTRTFDHRPFHLRRHLERLGGTLRELRIAVGMTLDDLEAVTLETLRRCLPTEDRTMDWQIIHNLSRGPVAPYREVYSPEDQKPTVIVTCFPIAPKLAGLAEKYTTGVDLRIPRQPALPPTMLPTHIKTRGRLHYKLADLELELEHPGAWAILADPTGQLTEGTSSNFFLVKNGRLKTPPEELVLRGVTRGVVLEVARKLAIPLDEVRLTPEDGFTADEMFVTSTSIGLLHARTFQGRAVGGGGLGPVAARLREALDAEVGLSFQAQAEGYAARQKAGGKV